MNTEEKAILVISKNICKNIDGIIENGIIENKRGFFSQNILNELRNLVEPVAFLIYNRQKRQDLEYEYPNLKQGINYIKDIAKYKSIHKFHGFLQSSVSHYTPNEDNAERLMLKYYEYLFDIKTLMGEEYKLNILENLHKFPLNLDTLEQEYQKKISDFLENSVIGDIKSENYYIQKIKPFFVDNSKYYEVSFTISTDNVSKFDRIIAFTKLDIMPNYAVKLDIEDTSIDFLERKFPVKIIRDWRLNIRPCEFQNFCRMFQLKIIQYTRTKLYDEFMEFLTRNRLTLLELVDLKEDEYQKIKAYFYKDKFASFFDCLDKCRKINQEQSRGINILRYLLYNFNNKIIKNQFSNAKNSNLSNLYLHNKSIPFDDMPYASSLAGHNPKIYDLLECINSEKRKHELFAREIKNNTENRGYLYTISEDLENFKNQNIQELIKKYNDKLYYKHRPSRDIISDNQGKIFYIKEYEEDVLEIIKKIGIFTSSGIENYHNDMQIWLQNNKNEVDCCYKKKYLADLFTNSKVVFIYGSAGVGKTTMIGHISKFFKEKKKLYLANTNTAVNNLRLRVNSPNSEFCTATSVISSKSTTHNEYDILIIDECSTISNKDMRKILERVSCKILICVGDIFQIEAIQFGNWFFLMKHFDFIPKNSIIELVKPYRTSDKKLLNLWESVRKLEDDIAEKLNKGSYCFSLDKFDFKEHHKNDDKIILCLNYGGVYGINNINRILQENNENKAFEFNSLIYKIQDPILFNETKKGFGNELHNNLKGRILNIEEIKEGLKFTLEIDKKIDKKVSNNDSFKLIEVKENTSIISFDVKKGDTDTDENDSSMPFQIAYAISIHKAQGLEYDSVNIIISNETEEQITHNIFYTAITRAKKDLKIFWSPETQNKILKSMKKRDNKRDFYILKNKKF